MHGSTKTKVWSKSDFSITDDNVSWFEIDDAKKSNFLGYKQIELESIIIKYRPLNDDMYEIVLLDTPFYGESGGQVGDKGGN